jgi:hypothetical protein
MTPERSAQFARLDELMAISEDDRSEDEWEEFERLAHLLADPEYQAHVRSLVESADQAKRH